MGQKEGYENFQADFRICAVTSFLKYCEQQLITANDVAEANNVVDAKWVKFAIDITFDNYKPETSTFASTIYKNVSG